METCTVWNTPSELPDSVGFVHFIVSELFHKCAELEVNLWKMDSNTNNPFPYTYDQFFPLEI